MSLSYGYDGDELRALAVSLEVIDPTDPDEWDGDEAVFTASVNAGRQSLQERGLARFARDGSAVITSDDVDELEAFLAPLAVVEVTVLDGVSVLMREWYIGLKTTVVATRLAADGAEQTLETTDSDAVLREVLEFIDLRGGDGSGEARRLPADDLLIVAAPSRLIMVDAVQAESAASGSVQILDSETEGLRLVEDVDGDGDDIVTITAASRAEVIERLYAALVAA